MPGQSGHLLRPLGYRATILSSQKRESYMEKCQYQKLHVVKIIRSQYKYH